MYSEQQVRDYAKDKNLTVVEDTNMEQLEQLLQNSLKQAKDLDHVDHPYFI